LEFVEGVLVGGASPWANDSRAHRISFAARVLETPRTSATRSGVAKGVVISCAAMWKVWQKLSTNSIADSDMQLEYFHGF